MYKKLVCILAIGCMCLTGCSSKETAKNEPEIVEEKEEDNTQTTEINEKQVIDEEEQDETKTALDKVLEDKLPYISYTNTKLGKDASEFLNSTSDILVSIDNTEVTSSYYLKDDDTIDYYMENNQRYIVGVSDDIVSVYAISATECVSAGVQVKDVFNGLDVDTPPYDIKVDTNCSLYLWRIDGGYLAVHVANVGNTSFLEKYVNHVVYLSNAEYHDVLRSFMPETESGNENQDESMEETENNTKESQTDNTTNAGISNEDVNAAVLRVYESVCSYINNSGVTEFNTNDIRTMYENWEMVKGLDIFEKPIDMEEYVAMRSGQTVSFYYDAGVQLIWNVEADTVDIIYSEE